MHGELAPLSRVTSILADSGPAQVSREHVQRRIVVEGQRAVARSVALPPGYELIWGGQYEHLQEAGRRQAMVVPVTLMLILGMLSVISGTLRPALLIFVNVPLALSGGILALSLRGLPLSISAIMDLSPYSALPCLTRSCW